MRPALDHARFLATSENRVTVLELLAEDAMTRRDIRDATDISQPTIGRILSDFVDRNWAVKDGHTYRLLPAGRVLAEKFQELLDTIEAMENVEAVAHLLPRDAPDPRHFADADVVTPNPSNVVAHLERAQQLIEDARDLRIVTPSVFPDRLREEAEHHRTYDRHVVVVHDDALYPVRTDPELLAIVQGFLDRDDMTIYRYDGDIEVLVAVLDGRAVIAPLDANGFPTATITSTTPAVVEWAETRFDRYVAESTPISREDLE